jgi:hypothetical protein
MKRLLKWAYWFFIGWIILLIKRLYGFVKIVGWVRTILSIVLAALTFYSPSIVFYLIGQPFTAVAYALFWVTVPMTPAMPLFLIIMIGYMFILSMTVSKERKQLLKVELNKLIAETKEEVLELVVKVQDFLNNNIGGTKP